MRFWGATSFLVRFCFVCYTPASLNQPPVENEREGCHFLAPKSATWWGKKKKELRQAMLLKAIERENSPMGVRSGVAFFLFKISFRASRYSSLTQKDKKKRYNSRVRVYVCVYVNIRGKCSPSLLFFLKPCQDCTLPHFYPRACGESRRSTGTTREQFRGFASLGLLLMSFLSSIFCLNVPAKTVLF